MKRIFTILSFSAIVAGAVAQNSFQLLDPDNSNADVSNTTFDLYGTFPSYIVKELNVKNSSSSTKTVKMKRTFVSGINMTVPNQDTIEICWNVCLQPSWNTTQNAGNVNIPAGDTASFSTSGIGFHATLKPANVTGVRVVRYTFWDLNNTADSVNVIVNYHMTATGINETNIKQFNFSNPQPNPAVGSTTIKYDFPFAAKSKIKVYNMVGTLVREVKLEGENGKITINTEDLTNGVYFYSLIVNDRIAGTKKLIVSN
jgi:hypothetical protein